MIETLWILGLVSLGWAVGMFFLHRFLTGSWWRKW